MAPPYRVNYQDNNGEIFADQHPLLLANTPIESLVPIRSPNNRRGQQHITGLHYSPATRLHHAFESRLEQKALIRSDFELRPQAIATQPFSLIYDDDGTQRTHVPDILIGLTTTRPLVIDVKPKVFVERNAVPFGAMRNACAEIGWDYAIWTESEPAYEHNLSFLYGYFRQPAGCDHITDSILTQLAQGPRSLNELETHLGPPCRARPVLFHLLWNKQIHADLSRPLTDHTLLHGEPT